MSTKRIKFVIGSCEFPGVFSDLPIKTENFPKVQSMQEVGSWFTALNFLWNINEVIHHHVYGSMKRYEITTVLIAKAETTAKYATMSGCIQHILKKDMKRFFLTDLPAVQICLLLKTSDLLQNKA